MNASELESLGQFANVVKIFVLLQKLEAKSHGRGSEALEWCYRDVREQGADIDWHRRMSVGGSDYKMIRDVQRLTGLPEALVFAIGRSVFTPSRASVLLDELRRFEWMYPNGLRGGRGQEAERMDQADRPVGAAGQNGHGHEQPITDWVMANE